METGCPLLRMAYIIAKALELSPVIGFSASLRMKHTIGKADIKDARSMGTYCAIYDKCQKLQKPE